MGIPFNGEYFSREVKISRQVIIYNMSGIHLLERQEGEDEVGLSLESLEAFSPGSKHSSKTGTVATSISGE